MRIHQVRCSKSVSFFEEGFKFKYGLVSYRSSRAPAVFFGCYRDEDIETIAEHASLAVVIWGGTDAMDRNTVSALGALDRSSENPIYHIAISSFVSNDLKSLGIPHLRRNLYLTNLDSFKPEPLGHKVYVYGGPQSGVRAHFYGLDRLSEIGERLPHVTFVAGHTSPPSFPHEHMSAVYRECCLGLRLTPHDGCSSTVVELGLMGRRCVWNGDLPNALPWQSTTCVVSAIEKELSMQGTTNTALAVAMREALANEDWLLTETYNRGVEG
jgi:hypothetical protein